MERALPAKPAVAVAQDFVVQLLAVQKIVERKGLNVVMRGMAAEAC